jgi:hypothetical protein
VSRSINKKQVAIIVKIFANKIFRAKLELDPIVAQRKPINGAFPKIDRHLGNFVCRAKDRGYGRGSSREPSRLNHVSSASKPERVGGLRDANCGAG